MLPKRIQAGFHIIAVAALVNGCVDAPTTSTASVEEVELAQLMGLVNGPPPGSLEVALENVQRVAPSLFSAETETPPFPTVPGGPRMSSILGGVTDHNGTRLGNYPIGASKYVVFFGPHWGYAGPAVKERTHINLDAHRTTAPFKYWASNMDEVRKTRIINLHVTGFRQQGRICAYAWAQQPWTERTWCMPTSVRFSEAVNTAANHIYSGLNNSGVGVSWNVAMAMAYVTVAAVILLPPYPV